MSAFAGRKHLAGDKKGSASPGHTSLSTSPSAVDISETVSEGQSGQNAFAVLAALRSRQHIEDIRRNTPAETSVPDLDKCVKFVL